MTTVAQLITRVREGRLDEPLTSGSQWTPANMLAYINEAIKDIARVTRHFKTQVTVPVSANVNTYILVASILEIELVYFIPTADTTRVIPLRGAHMEALDQQWGEHQNISSGYPAIYTVYGSSPTLEMRLYPVPSMAGALRIHCAVFPAELTTDADTLAIPAGWEDVVEEYVEYMALRKDRDQRFQVAFGMYQQKLEALVDHDYINSNREVIHDAWSGGIPRWLAEFE